jgi:hypothetical protein
VAQQKSTKKYNQLRIIIEIKQKLKRHTLKKERTYIKNFPKKIKNVPIKNKKSLHKKIPPKMENLPQKNKKIFPKF